MTRMELNEILRDRLLVCDGAMGTQLMKLGLTGADCGEGWNIERPADVTNIHKAYLAAGCDMVTTNTFGGTSCALERHGLKTQVHELNQAGAKLARTAVKESGKTAWVLGDVGPFGGFIEPVGDMPADQLLAIFMEQCAALHAGGADAILVETMVDPAEVVLAVKAALSIGNWPVLATYAFGKAEDAESGGFRTIMGTGVKQAMDAAIDAGATVVGANCGTGLSLEDYQRLADAMVRAAGDVPVMIQPNAGAPILVDGKVIHPATSHEMAAMVAELRNSGVRIIGGCCGTTPAHLQAMAKAIHEG